MRRVLINELSHQNLTLQLLNANSGLPVLIYVNISVEKESLTCACLHTPVIPALGLLRQEDGKFQASLGYIARPYVKPNF
jgi:hypothetical protein